MSSLFLIIALYFTTIQCIPPEEPTRSMNASLAWCILDADCNNVGECKSGQCICPSGWDGPQCKINIDDCDPNPCLNQGECMDAVNSYSCVCYHGYTGDHCETHPDDDCVAAWGRCGPNPGPLCCVNGYVCNYQSKWYAQCVPPNQVWSNQPPGYGQLSTQCIDQCEGICQDFGIATSSSTDAESSNEARLTLLYNENRYQCEVTPSAISTEYSCLCSSSLEGTGCDNYNIYDGRSKLDVFQIQNLADDALIIDYIFITDSHGIRHQIGLNELCLAIDEDDCDSQSNVARVNLDDGTIVYRGYYIHSCDRWYHEEG